MTYGGDYNARNTFTADDVVTVRNMYQVGENIEIGIPKSETGKRVFIKVSIIAKYTHHCLCRMSSGLLESFRWLDLVTVYSVRSVK